MSLNRPLSSASLRSARPWPMQAFNLSKGRVTTNTVSRVSASGRGDPLDRPPVTSCVHFQSDRLSAHEVAQQHLRFLEAFDWDVLKVMNAFRYPVPAGVEDLSHADVFKQYRP